MKHLITKSFIILFVFFISIISGRLQANGNTECNCKGTIVKFNWDKTQGLFILEDDHNAHGIEISNVVVDEDNEPHCFEWSSPNPWVISVCLKLGNDYEPTTYPSGSYGGTICGQVKNAISNIQFCVDETLPVELTSFSVSINNNLAKLNWETATEVNNYGFEVERTSENNDWSKLGFVEGHGNSNSPKYYSFIDNSLNESGKYSYRLKQIDIDGTYVYSDVVNIDLSAPAEFKLNQNYPNPFNPTTSINYSISEDTYVELIVYDILGNKVAVLEKGYKDAGSYNRSFDASSLSSGLYFYTIKAGNFSSTMKMLLTK